ncbi:hypothetical protein ACFQV2_06010 [Actinokineospora soli]|uniref:Uncharacterized protein n=1 Tax=Actinokineospora soli TaxID=1048753 RepID=A0ABW2TK60_9PSEU
MSDDESGRKALPLRAAIEELAKGRGVWRGDLADVMRHELRELRKLWGIHPDADDAIVRTEVGVKIEKLIDRIVAFDGRSKRPSPERTERLRRVARVWYNVDVANRHLKNKPLTERVEWLALEAKPDERVPVSSSTRDIAAAREQMVAMILDAAGRLESQGASAAADVEERTETAPSQPLPRTYCNLKLAGSIAAVLAIGVAGTVYALSSDSASNVNGNQPPGASANQRPGEVVPPQQPAPLKVMSVAYVQGMRQGPTYAFAKPLNLADSDLATISSLQTDPTQYAAWMYKHGGVASNEAQVQVVLNNPLTVPVVITDIVVKKECREPLTGALIYSPPAGQNEALQIIFNLDDPVTVAHGFEGGEDRGPYFGGTNAKTITISPNNPMTLALHAVTRKQYCEFSYTFRAAPADGAPTTVPVNDNGKPFAVTVTGETGEDGKPVTFASYKEVYGGGVASPTGDNQFRKVDPATYRGY